MKQFLLLSLFTAAYAHADPLLTYENRPLGKADAPLLISSYLPDPGLDSKVFQRYHAGLPTQKYSPEKGADQPGDIKPIPGIAAALAINFGPGLSYVFDTEECRPLYAWQGGFLDFTPYWGDQKRGSRISFDYIPRLVGTLLYKAEGKHPLSIDGKAVDDIEGGPTYIGYKLEKGNPRFAFRAGKHVLRLLIAPSPDALSYQATWTSDPPAKLVYKEGDFTASGQGKIEYTYAGKALGQYRGYEVNLDLSKPSVKTGEALFNNYGCLTCHSLDGSNGHGPTLASLYNSKVPIVGSKEPVIADEAYLLESIKNPNAKIVQGYPANYMPPFALPDVETKSLVLFLQSLDKPE